MPGAGGGGTPGLTTDKRRCIILPGTPGDVPGAGDGYIICEGGGTPPGRMKDPGCEGGCGGVGSHIP
jgi:hypothetical protein